ncbi:D-inositol-3-phosphate glycosyltransferase [ANME-1 cluster archaeon GoMg2]|nr:D-inositol-3-phosphate glycosyltransferase [ANME-1 cluster archaeon GoMg2]
MKIIQVSPRYYPDIGGVETHVKEMSERLVRKGFEVEMVTTDPSGKLRNEDVIKGVKVRRFRSVAPNDAYFIAPQIYFYLKKANCDVIHAHNYHALPAFFAALAKNDRKFVFTSHYHGKGHTVLRNILHKPYKFFGSTIFKNADRIICVSLYEKKLIKKNFGCSDEKLLYIPNGINLEEFRIKGSVKNEKAILYVGRLEKYKGVQHIIEALPYLDGYRLVIVGKGPYEGELRKLASSINVDGRIEWLKDLPREELLEQYKSAGVFVSLSSFEAFGITVAEALASETPCIVAKRGALEEFVDNKMCIGIEPSAENLVRVISQIKRDTTSTKAIKDWNEVVERIIRVYEGD